MSKLIIATAILDVWTVLEPYPGRLRPLLWHDRTDGEAGI